jgi:hypothetical protein
VAFRQERYEDAPPCPGATAGGPDAQAEALLSNWKDQSPPASIPPDIKRRGLMSESTSESGSITTVDDLDIFEDVIA